MCHTRAAMTVWGQTKTLLADVSSFSVHDKCDKLLVSWGFKINKYINLLAWLSGLHLYVFLMHYLRLQLLLFNLRSRLEVTSKGERTTVMSVFSCCLTVHEKWSISGRSKMASSVWQQRRAQGITPTLCGNSYLCWNLKLSASLLNRDLIKKKKKKDNFLL